MKLPQDAKIAREKISDYLLVRQKRGDKSAFLELAGYDLTRPDQLERDLREQALPLTASMLHKNEFGQYYEIRAKLQGPNGRILSVQTIWLREHLSGQTKFITLIPDRKTE